jgi:hypothetical protein
VKAAHHSQQVVYEVKRTWITLLVTSFRLARPNDVHMSGAFLGLTLITDSSFNSLRDSLS